MVYSGIIAILIAIWIYRTAIDAKISNKFFWIAGSVIAFMVMKVIMIYFNAAIIEIFDTDIGDVYDNAGGLNSRDNSDTAGLQTGPGGTLIGILFELSPAIFPFLGIAVLRLLVMLRQPFGFMALFGGIKEMFIAIGDSFKTGATENTGVKIDKDEKKDDETKE